MKDMPLNISESPPSGDCILSPLLGPDEPPAFEILYPDGASPFLLTADHAANRIPRALGDLGLTLSERSRHIGWDIGIAGVARRLAASLNAWTILQNYSRLVIDCNRPPHAPSAIPLRSENTDIPGNLALTQAARDARHMALFAPYHAAIAAALDARQAAGRPTFLITLHSFTPVYDTVVRPMHAAVLYNRDARLADALMHRLRGEAGLIVGDNAPYRVSDESDYAIPVHGEQRGLPHVEIEIRQDLIECETGQAAWAARLARLLAQAVLDAGL